MKLLPVDIRNKHFQKALFGGYKSAEVKEFLTHIAEQYVKVSSHNTELESRLQDAQVELDRVRQIEGALLDALKSAEDQQQKIIGQSKKEARIRVMEGEVAAEALVNTAKQRAQNMLHQVKNECETKMQQMNKDFELLDHSYQEVETHVDKLIEQMQVFVDETNAKIAHLGSLKNRKAVADKLATAKELLESNEANERLANAERQVKRPYDIEIPKMPQATAPQASVNQDAQGEEAIKKKDKAKEKPKNIHETLAEKQLGHLPDIDMSNFFGPIQE